MSLWLCECPNDDQGMVRPLLTRRGRVVLVCDEGGEVWLHPSDVASGQSIQPSGTELELLDGDSIRFGTTRWADDADVRSLGWDVFWHRYGAPPQPDGFRA